MANATVTKLSPKTSKRPTRRKARKSDRLALAIGAGIPTLLLAIGAMALGSGSGAVMAGGLLVWAAGLRVSLPHVADGLRKACKLESGEAWALAGALDLGWAMAEVALHFGQLDTAGKVGAGVVLALGWLGSTALNIRSFR